MEQLNKQEKRLKLLCEFWMVMLSGATIVFFFFGNLMLESLNAFSLKFFPHLPSLPLPQDQFWICLIMSMMFTLTFMCYMTQRNIRKYHHFMLPFMLSKFVSTTFFLLYFIFELRAFAYFVAVLTDGFMFLLTYFIYKPVLKASRSS